MKYEPRELIVDGDIYGIHTQAKLIDRYTLFDICGNQLDAGTLPQPENEYDDIQDYWDNQSALDDRIHSGDICVRLADSPELWAVEWSDGSLWAIHPKAEWCETCESYHWSPEYLNVTEYTIAAHYASAIINNDWSGLDYDDSKALTEWLATNEYYFMTSICPNSESEFARDEISGLMSDCIKLTVSNEDIAKCQK